MSKSKKTPIVKQKDLVIAVILSLILGFGGGLIVGTATTDNSTETSTPEPAKDSTHSHPNTYEATSTNPPTVKILVTEDAKSGYNIQLETENFEFTPQNINKENTAGQGHAHLYVDGVKISRLYGPNFHYDKNFEGSKTFKIVLNTNNHDTFTVNGEAIETSVVVTHNGDSLNHKNSH